ncbi:hypothetical protein Q4E40_16085 [Pontibacter sp. BT731]|uniref:toxin-antitoxin system YwqK family antitoxin n=1 Tax=Pontibacter coccineus TaxID=3063328 RepID=UPI0026E3D8CD|nr:hypothetical protein [Pontibacter sp. BT731]MDO6391655.1 hypothetical protein [Pontibacter sp. BT731]
MKTISFRLFLGNIVLLVIAYFFASFRTENNFQVLSLVMGISVLISAAGVIVGALKFRKLKGINAWSGILANSLILIMFVYLVIGGKEQVQQRALQGYNPSSIIRGVNVNHDTLNSGETYEVTILSDTSYFNRFGEYPQLRVNDNPYSSISASSHSLLFHSVSESVEGAAIKRRLSLKIRLKQTFDRDTVLHYDKTYFITNLESSPRSEGKLVNGHKEGQWRFWYDNDRKHLKEQTEWHNGQMHGRRTLYWKSGKPMRIYTYNEDVLNGMSYWISSAGALHDSLLYKDNKEVRITKR